jgi:hypothetical protein
MTSRQFIAGSVAAGCIAAAGVGGFLAVRTATHSSQAASLPAAETSGIGLQSTATPTRGLGDVAGPVAAASAAPSKAAQTSRGLDVRPEPARPVSEVSTPDAPERTTSNATVSAPPVYAPEVPAPVVDPPPPALPRVTIVEIPSNAVIGIRLDTTVSSETANVEDTVRARVTRPVVVDGITVLPTGARLVGAVTMVERGGKIRERARVGIRFTSVVLGDDLRIPIQTEAIYRDGEGPAREATAKIGASAVVGSILGGVFGGKKGAVIGGAAGAAGGTAIVVAGDRNAAVLASGSALTLRLSEPAAIEIER